ncbi:MAG: FtsX-like permease family protein [Thermoplasmata archaeon]
MRPAAELFVILLLGASLLTASFPFYTSLARTPEDLFYGPGVYVIGQASTRQPLTEEWAEELRGQPWALTVSPEIYALVGWDGQAVVVRGVQPWPFLAMEGLPSQAPLGPTFLLLGERLAARLGVGVGDALLLPGSTQPVLVEATVDGVLPAQGAVADEALVDLPRARLLAGLGGTVLTLLRVAVQEIEPLLAYLVSAEREVVVAGDGESRLVQGGVILDDRIGSLILTNPDLGRELGRTYIGAFAQHSGNSLAVLVLGMEGLTVLLIAVMMASSLTRFWVERRGEVGLFRALGGRGPAALRLFGGRLLALGVPATAGGLFAGVGIGLLLESTGAYAFLGHALPYALNPSDFLLLGALYLGAFGLVVLLGLAFLLRQRPRDLLHTAPEPSSRVWENLDE